MLEVNMKSEDKKDPLADTPISSYEEFLDEMAKEFVETPAVVMFKGAVEFVRYLATREMLFIHLLVEKEVMTLEEVDTYLGPKAHKATQSRGLKSLTKHLLKAASEGKLISPTGKKVRPDETLVIINDILDLNDTGWDGRTIELIAEMRGDAKEIREQYNEHVKEVETLNKLKALRRKKRKEKAERERQERVDREHAVRIYVSRCRISDKPLPNDEEQRLMIEGHKPIPKVT